jgi:hypothetical protein
MIEAFRRGWRGELSHIGLAAMECCWLYPWLRFLTGEEGAASRVPFLALLAVLLSALYLTRLLRHESVALWTQRALLVGMAILSALFLLRLRIYTNYGITDPGWLLRFAREAGQVLQYIPRSLTVFAMGLYLSWRGISLAQRELDVASAGLSFRIGIIAFFWLFAVGVFGVVVEATAYAFAYFSLGLVVMGLARTHDVSQSQAGIRSPFNAAWMAILFGSALLVSVIGRVAAWVLSLQTIRALLVWLNPAWRALAWAASPVVAAFSWLLEMVLTVLVRFFASLFGSPDSESSPLSRLIERLQILAQQPQANPGHPSLLLQILKWGFLATLLAGCLGALALSIAPRRRARQSDRLAEHELVAAGQGAGDAIDAWEDRLLRFRDQVLSVLARMRGEEYALASIRQIYASLTRLSEAAGFPRRKAQTPYEYVHTLQQAFPHSPDDIVLITDAYVRVRYGQQRFAAEYVERVRQAWLTVRLRHQHSRGG